MLPPNTDPDVRKYDNLDDFKPCSECGTWILPLQEYEIEAASESPTAGAELWEFILWGWMAFVYNYVYDLFTFKERQLRLARLKAEILPQFPRSLVCPGCLRVTKRR